MAVPETAEILRRRPGLGIIQESCPIQLTRPRTPPMPAQRVRPARPTRIRLWLTAGAAGLAGLLAGTAEAVNTVAFSTADVGVTKSVASWGIDAAWPSFDNVRLAIANMGGPENVDFTRICWDTAEPVIANGDGTFSVTDTTAAFLDHYLSLASLAGPGKAIAIVPGSSRDYLDPSYQAGAGINVTNWTRAIRATVDYIHSKPEFADVQIAAVEVFNEPDFWTVQGNASRLNSAIGVLKADPTFAATSFQAASTLNSDNAQAWYDQVPNADAGSSHLLAGSLTTWTQFIDAVQADGKPFANLEIHSLGEMIAGAEHGMSMASVWASQGRAMGQFVQASAGTRLGYYEDLGNQSAAAVYRGPDGRIQAFASGLERTYTGTPAAYRFVATDRDVYFNGIPTREFMMQTRPDYAENFYARYGAHLPEGAVAEVELAPSAIQAIDGYRWKIVNAQTGQVMEVVGSGTADGDLIRSATDTGGLNQRWDIVRSPTGIYQLYNAASGKTAEIAWASLDDGGFARQWGTADNPTQQWMIEDAGNGNLFLRNANSFKYLTTSSTNSTQGDLTGGGVQQWKLVLDNPTAGPVTRYQFAGSLADSGSNATPATAVGGVSYVAGPTAGSTAVRLNGTTGYVQLPAGEASSSDLTVSMSVKWDGGNAFQRIFDFGDDTTTNMFLTPRDGAGQMRFSITTGGYTAEETLVTDALPVGEWVDLTLTLGGNTGILYVNGKPQVAGNIFLDPADISGTNNFLGKSQYADALFAGSVADFRIYDYALTQAQVMDLTTRPLTWAGGVWNGSAASFTAGGQATSFRYGDTVSFDGSGGSTVTLSGDLSPRSVTVTAATDLTFTGSGSIIGPGSLVKTGTGRLIVANTGTNFFAGGTTINGGTLQVGNGGTGGSLGLGDVVNNGQLVLNRSDTLTQGNGLGTISGTGRVVIQSGRVVMSGINTYTGGTTIAAGATLQLGAGSASGSIRPNTLLNQGELALNRSDTATQGVDFGTIQGTGRVTVEGGRAVLNATNTYTGGTTINAGTLVAARSSTLGSGLVVMNGGSLTSGNTGGSEPTLSNPIRIAGASEITAAPGTLFRINGNLSGSGALSLAGIFNGAGLRLTGNNAGFTGSATVTGANTRLGATTSASAAAAWIVDGNLQTDVVGGGSFQFGSLAGSGTISGHAANAAAATSTLVIGSLGTNTTFSGSILDNAADTVATGNSDGARNNRLAVTKLGGGTLTLGGPNSYTGPTTVRSGTLELAHANAVATTLVTVEAGATLAVAAGTTPKSPGVTLAGGGITADSLLVSSTTGIASLAINAGTIAGSPLVTLTSAGLISLPQAARVTVAIGGLALNQAAGGGRLDLGAGQVSIAAGGISASDLRADLVAGRASGGWNGSTGIASSAAAASGGTRTVGYVMAADGSARVSYAAAGDVDLGGEVNVFDLVSINGAGRYGSGQSADWSQGDFNYDGVTNVFDLVGINTATAYGQGSYLPVAAAASSGILSAAAVPEPWATLPGCLAALWLARAVTRRS
ncbi:MAG: hypothetical protein RLZZ440_2192 [Planctomycetota bacterium]